MSAQQQNLELVSAADLDPMKAQVNGLPKILKGIKKGDKLVKGKKILSKSRVTKHPMRLSSKILKRNFEKRLMKAIISETVKEQHKQKEKVIEMNFELKPLLKFSHHLMGKVKVPHISKLNTENPASQELVHFSQPKPAQKRPLISTPSQNPPHKPSPHSYSSPCPFMHDILSPSFPLPQTVGVLEASKETFMMAALKSWI